MSDAGNGFESYSKEYLDDLFSLFYAEIRNSSGKWYSKSSYIGIRAALQRHLRGEPFNVVYNLVDDVAFKNSNEVLTGIFKKISREGLDKVKHHNPIELGDLVTFRTTGTIGIHSPRALQNLVWLNVAIHFARRGRENYRMMTKNTYQVAVDGDGRRFIEPTFCEKTKNHQGNKASKSHMSQARIYEIEGDELCPVDSYEVYIACLNPDLEELWQKPNPHYLATGNWYCRLPVGKNTLGNMMANICAAAKITNRYTNHCTRVTAAVILNEEGFNETDICKVTGHSSTASLKHYNHRATTSKKGKCLKP